MQNAPAANSELGNAYNRHVDHATPSMMYAISNLFEANRSDTDPLWNADIVEIVFDFHPSDGDEDWHITLIAHNPNVLTRYYEKKRYHGYRVGLVPPSRALTATNFRVRDSRPPVSQLRAKLYTKKAFEGGAAGYPPPRRISLKVRAEFFRGLVGGNKIEAENVVYAHFLRMHINSNAAIEDQADIMESLEDDPPVSGCSNPSSVSTTPSSRHSAASSGSSASSSGNMANLAINMPSKRSQTTSNKSTASHIPNMAVPLSNLPASFRTPDTSQRTSAAENSMHTSGRMAQSARTQGGSYFPREQRPRVPQLSGGVASRASLQVAIATDEAAPTRNFGAGVRASGWREREAAKLAATRANDASIRAPTNAQILRLLNERNDRSRMNLGGHTSHFRPQSREDQNLRSHLVVTSMAKALGSLLLDIKKENVAKLPNTNQMGLIRTKESRGADHGESPSSMKQREMEEKPMWR